MSAWKSIFCFKILHDVKDNNLQLDCESLCTDEEFKALQFFC